MARNQTQKYRMCSICNEFSYPIAPYRIYEAEINEHGVVVSTTLLFSASSREEAERWAREHCRRIVTCV